MKHTHDKFDPTCPGCRPTLYSATGGPVPEEITVQVDRIFMSAPIEEREAWFRVTVKESKDPNDTMLVASLSERLHKALGVTTQLDRDGLVTITAVGLMDALRDSGLSPREGLTALNLATLTIEALLVKPGQIEESRAKAREIFRKGPTHR